MKICILGAGAYGIALALSFYRNNNQVTVWTKIEAEKDEIITTRQNKKALPGVLIPEEIMITTDLGCIQGSDLVVLAIPVSFFRSTCLELKNYIYENLHFCIATKGIENQTGLFCHEILSSIIPIDNISVLSGPTFAIDLANNSISGLTLAANSDTTYELVLKSLQNKRLKIEKCNDITGVEICGSVKNIMAIISGMLDGMQVTENTKALFLKEAIHEIGNLITEFKGSYYTINTLAGIGDLLLTCNSTKSRNFSLGRLLVTADKDCVLEYIENNTVEGYYTLISVYQLIKEKDIKSPLIEALYQILFQEKTKEELFNVLINN